MSSVQLIFLGAPGSGKGTQATKLVSKKSFVQLSTGDLLRSEVHSKSDLGNRVKKIMDEGKLVDDSVVLELLKSRCDLDHSNYIFDGFPRNIKQTIALDESVLQNVNSKAIYFKLDLGVLTSRLINRRTCAGCGEIFNLSFRIPKIEGKCDLCNGELKHRKDDNELTVKTRLGVFEDSITPIIEYYSEKERLIVIDASKNPSDVYDELINACNF